MTVAAAVCCFLPLADHLGYEFSEIMAVLAGLFGGLPGMRRDRKMAVLALLVPLAMILMNGVRRPACDPVAGLTLFTALAVPSAALAYALGAACALIAPRRPGWLYAAIFLATLAAALWPVARGPQVFAFHHLGGMYPGPIYDEAIRPSRALWLFRLTTLLYAGACAFFASGRRGCAALMAAGAVAMSLQAERFHWQASAAALDAALGGSLTTEHLVLHFPREKAAGERDLLAKSAETDVRAVMQFLALNAAGPRVDVWLYRSADEKRTLIGAAETSFTKPWLRQIHVNDAPPPHPILRHELVHALGAQLAHGPWGVPGRLRGWIPEMALIEGVAVAGDWPAGEFTVHEEARALRALKLMPDVARLFRPGVFYAESGPRAYTTAGSFVRWVWEARRPANIYAPLDAAALAPEYEKFLDAVPAPERAVALASQRFSAPAIVRKRCAHEVAGLAHEAARTGDPALWQRCVELEPDDPALLLSLWRAQPTAENADRLLAHPKLSKPLRAQALTEMGDAAWKSGDAAEARRRYEEARQLPQPEAAERGLAVRLRALDDPPTWPALRPLFTETNADILLRLRDLDLARPRDGLFAYLIAKQLQNRATWEDCAKYAASALGRELPGPRFVEEALRMRGIAAWHLGDAAAARAAFTALGKDAPPGRAVEAARWLDAL
ncbi:MAG TPA: hypothetical protein VLW85_10020 [Myxococcales bacterium]|nr:hypothetical protein [Myxococcales bacterium]